MATPRSEGRLHPAAVAVWSLGQLGGLALLWLIGPLGGPSAVVLGGVVVAANVVRFLRFRWRVADGALVIDQGLLQRRRRVIPLERIQGVDLVRTLRHRLLRVVEVRAEAIGGADTDGRLDALAPADAAAVRELLLGHGPAEEPATPAGEVLAEVTPGTLVLAGLTGGRVGVMAALLGSAQQVLPEDFARTLERLPAALGVQGLLGLAAAVLGAAFVLSVVAAVVTQWGFTLLTEPDALRVRRGLLEQRLETIPHRRVQAVRVEENLVRRLFGLAAVKVDLAGRGTESRSSGVLLPLASRGEALALAGRLADVAVDEVELAAAPGAAYQRRVVRALVVSGALAALGALLAWPVGLAAGLLAVPAVAAARASYRALGQGRVGDVVVVRYGFLVRRTAFVPTSRVHSLALTASPFQRRLRLATLELQIPRSPGAWGGPKAVDLDAATGRRLLDELARALPVAVVGLVTLVGCSGPAVTEDGPPWVRSVAFEVGDGIPVEHTCDGEDAPVPLRWVEVPAAAVELVIVVDDADADGFVHWLVAGLPATDDTTNVVGEGVEGTNDFGRIGWAGPCPPEGDGAHTYRFQVIALSAPSGLEPGFTADDLAAATDGTRLGVGLVTATYER